MLKIYHQKDQDIEDSNGGQSTHLYGEQHNYAIYRSELALIHH